MPKNKTSKKNNKGSLSLFSCITVPVEREEMVISGPIQFSEEQRQLLVEIGEKMPILKNLSNKTDKDLHLFSLMFSIHNNYEKKIKSLEEINSLKEMLNIYAEKEIDWSQYGNTTENLNKTSIDAQPIQLPQGSLLSQIALKASILNKVTQYSEKTKTKPIFPNASPMLINELATAVKKERPQPGNLEKQVRISNSAEGGGELSELAKKFAEFKERKPKHKEENTVNTDSVTNATNISNDDSEWLSNVSNAQKIKTSELDFNLRKLEVLRPYLQSQEFSDKEFEIIENAIFMESKGQENEQVTPLSVIEEDDEFTKILKICQESLSELNDRVEKSQAPLSLHFNKAPDKDEPVIVKEFSKPKFN